MRIPVVITLAVATGLLGLPWQGPLASNTAGETRQEDKREARAQLLARCGIDDWMRPVSEFKPEDVEVLDRLIPLAAYNKLSAADLESKGNESPPACKKLKPIPPPSPPVVSARADSPGLRCEPSCFSREETAVPAPNGVVRFAVIGDAGYRGEKSFQDVVAKRIREVCGVEDQGGQGPTCAFAVFLGDNLYPDGISHDAGRAREDRKTLAKFIRSYRLPAYVALGNHDWHPYTASLRRATRALDFIGAENDMFGNAHFYDFQAGPIHLWAMDSNYIVRAPGVVKQIENSQWLKRLRDSQSVWKIAFGHHPYLSNGHHGNAGEFRDAWVLGWRGEKYRDFMRRHILGKVDLLLAGHEHNLQFYPNSTRGRYESALVVSGSSAKCDETWKNRNSGHGNTVAPTFEVYAPGFTIVEATSDRLTVEMHWRQGGSWDQWTTYKNRGGRWGGNGPRRDTDKKDRCTG